MECKVIPRELTYSTQLTIAHQPNWYVKPDGRLDLHKLLSASSRLLLVLRMLVSKFVAYIRNTAKSAYHSVHSDTVFRRLLSNSSWLFSASTVSMALTFIQGIVVARMLGPAQYGILALVITLTATVNQFVDSRVWETAIKFVIQYREEDDFARATATVKLCYLIDAITGGLAFGVVVLAAGPAARVLIKDGSAAGLIQFYALSVLIMIPNGTSSALLRVGDRFDWLAYQNTVMAVLKLVGVLIVALLGGKIKEVVLVYLVSTAVGIFILLVLSQRTAKALHLIPWRSAPLHLLRGQYRRILTFTMYSNLVATSRLITSKADILILGWFTTPSNVGLYRLARTISDPLSVVFSSIYKAVYPELSRLIGRGDFQSIRSLQRRLSSAIAAIVFPAGLLLTFGLFWFIPAAFGEKYLGTITLTQIMVWQLIWTPLIWLPGLLLSMERGRMLAGLNWLDAFNYLGLLFLLVPRLNALGAAIATLLRYILWTLMALVVIAHLNQTAWSQEEKA